MADIKEHIGQRIMSAEVASTHNIFGIRGFELRVYNADGYALGTQVIPMEFLKAEGITYTLNGKRQVTEWANSEAGLKWLRENYGTDAKHIAQVKYKVMEESVRRKLPSLSPSEVDALMRKGIAVYHNGGVRKRHVVGVGVWVAYKTRQNTNNTAAEPLHNFAKWCKGFILPDGTVVTKGQTDPQVWEGYIHGDAGKDEETASV